MVLRRFRTPAIQLYTEGNSARVVGGLQFALAAYLVASSFVGLAGYRGPRPRLVGIAILIAGAVIMPLIANEKRTLSAATGSAALRADAVQSETCAYLSVIALAGLAANAVWRVAWADPIAALTIVPFVVWEDREAVRGRLCACC
jgi:divalent metal cation (Fe/Co/Zn/Cd) transporter